MNTQTEKLQKIANGEIDHEQAVEILKTAWAEIKKSEQYAWEYRDLIQKAEVFLLYGTAERPVHTVFA